MHPPLPPFDDRWLQRLLPELSDLPHLERLTLCHTAITDDGLHGVSRLKTVRAIDLSQTAVTDAALPELAAMPALEKVDLSDTEVTTEGRLALQTERPGIVIEAFDYSESVPPRLP